MSDAVFLCPVDWEAALVAELRRTAAAEAQPVQASVLRAALADDAEPTVAFAQQCLPAAVPCSAPSIAAWSEAACREITDRLDAVNVPWRLHVYPVATDDQPPLGGRAKLISARISESLRETRRRLAKRCQADAADAWLADEALVQVILTSVTTGFVSVCMAADRHRLRRVVSRFVGGRVEQAVDKEAPSRAFAKLVEVERRLNRPIAAGESCVDLGSAPGSWTYTAAARGAYVTAVDRSPLRDDLMRHPRVRFVRGDAFRYRPEGPVDWLLSDVIAYPDRIDELLRAWLGERLCKRFCVTIKFHGRDDDALLEPIKAYLTGCGYEFALRRLDANKNEATAYGTRLDDSASYTTLV